MLVPLRCLALLVGILLLGACSSKPKSTRATFPTSRAAAEQGLKTLKTLADAADYAKLGFSSVSEVPSAMLGPRFTIRDVSVDSLRRFPGLSAPAAPKDMGEEAYLVEVGGKARVLLFVQRHLGQWSPMRYGGVPVALRLEKAFNDLHQNVTPRPSQGSLLHIPAFGMYLLEDPPPPAHQVIPLRTIETIDAGKTQSLDDVFRVLKPLAEKLVGQFPE